MDDQPCRDFFLRPRSASQRRYEALRAFFAEERPSAEVALQFGYKPAAFKVMISQFRHVIRNQGIPPFSSRTAAVVPQVGLAATTATDPTRPQSPIGEPST